MRLSSTTMTRASDTIARVQRVRGFGGCMCNLSEVSDDLLAWLKLVVTHLDVKGVARRRVGGALLMLAFPALSPPRFASTRRILGARDRRFDVSPHRGQGRTVGPRPTPHADPAPLGASVRGARCTPRA